MVSRETLRHSPGLYSPTTIKQFIIGLIIAWLLLAVGILIKPKELIAEDDVSQQEIVQGYTKDQLITKVHEYAEDYNVNPHTMIKIINCENREWDVDLQSRIINKNGVREKSYGLSQWFLPAKNKTEDGRIITKEIATNPDESLSAMAWHISKYGTKKWTCARKLGL